MKQCTCNSLDLFKGGCLCGSLQEEAQPEGIRSGVAIAVLQSPVSTFMRDVKRIQAPKGNVIRIPLVPNPSSLLYMLPISASFQFAWDCIPCNGQTLVDWLPEQAPKPGEHFNGVDRSINVAHLAGLRCGAAGAVNAASVMGIAHMIATVGGCTDAAYAGSAAYQLLQADKATTIYGPAGAFDVLEDTTLPPSNVYLLQRNTWAYDEVNEVLFCLQPFANGVLIG